MKKEKKGDRIKAFLDFDLSTIVVSVAVVVLSFAFFILLNVKTDYGFGLREILFAIVLSAVAIVFLLWVKKMTVKDSYMGLTVGLFGLGLSIYGIYVNFRGFYTNIFAILTALIILAYLGFIFFKNRKVE